MEATPNDPRIPSSPLLWRGGQTPRRVPALPTGHPALDAVLPGPGWPLGAITEIIHAVSGCGELGLLLPALARLSREGLHIVMVDPPWIPYPPALQGRGLDPGQLLLVRTQDRKESLWACEQVLRGLPGGAVLAWPAGLSFSALRRLQLAAGAGQQALFVFREPEAANAASPAALRLQLTPADNDLEVKVLKCRGPRPAAAIRLKLQAVSKGSGRPSRQPASTLPAGVKNRSDSVVSLPCLHRE